MSYPNATIQTLVDEAAGIDEILISEVDKKRYVFELVVASGNEEYFWWEGNELHFLQKVYQIK